MSKVISVFDGEYIQNRTGKTLPSLLNRYTSLKNSCGGEIPLDRLCKFFSGENARFMNYAKEDGSLDSAATAECKEFAAFYIQNVSEEVRKKVFLHFGKLPMFLQSGIDALAADNLPFPWNCCLRISDTQATQIMSFVNFVEGVDNDILLTLRVTNPDNGQPAVQSYAILAESPLASEQGKRNQIINSVACMVQYGGKAVLRKRQPDGKFILMGVVAKNGSLQPIPGEKLKQGYEQNPQCPNAQLANIEFKTPEWL